MVKAVAKWIENVRSVVDNARKHSIVLDLPEGQDGDDTGATALELAVMGLAGCALTIFADVAKKSNVKIKKLEVVAEAEKAQDAPKLKNVELKISVAADARPQKLRAIWRRTEANCPVLSIFQDANPIKAELNVIEE